jgi:hypothetical protein
MPQPGAHHRCHSSASKVIGQTLSNAAVMTGERTALVKIAHITGLFFAVGAPHNLGRFMQNHAQ